MKVPYSWLADWVDIPWSAPELGSRLTMAGFELDGLEPAAPAFTGVVVAEILSAERHPQADKLQVCKVSVGSGEPVQIVCGAANARAGLKSALAVVGAKLPGEMNIKAAKLRGVESQGMLASAKELGLAETSAGILELPADAPVGTPLREYLALDDYVLDLAITPNRGDAMSIVGIAREVAALTGKGLKGSPAAAPLTVSVEAPSGVGVTAELSYEFTSELEVLEATDPATTIVEAWAPEETGSGPIVAAARNALIGSAGATGRTGVAAPGASSRDTVAVHLDAPAACPTFVGCVVHGVNNRAVTPVWLRERLRRAGVRSISPVVDVTQYVMLELGQPMHAYDLAKLQGDIRVRTARAGEPITLLDGKTVETSPDVLLITDSEGPVGLAGIMGGQRTSVSPETVDVFFEIAWFAPYAIAGRSRRWGMVTDASQRYERGVDPTLQQRAMDRALNLLRSFAGGTAGQVSVTQSAEHQPVRKPVPLRRARLERLLGVGFADDRIVATLTALQMRVVANTEGWLVTPPAHRFDISIEADLIEEVARIIGYQAIPEADAIGPQVFRAAPEERAGEQVIVEALAMRGYEEAITFAFVDPALQKKLFPATQGLPLANPIASDLAVMRVSLWPGLLRAALENQRRQQDRIRLFEHGAKFAVVEGGIREIDSLAAVATGTRLPEQWGIPRETRVPVDFYDVKADVQALFTATGGSDSFVFEAPVSPPSCLHPGRTARILRQGREVGWLGELHPSLVRELEFSAAPVLFELEMDALGVQKPQYSEISRFPQVRRDLAVVVDETVALSALAERVVSTASQLLCDLRIFDVYRGPGVEAGRKSIALGLIFQDISRTLTDEDVEQAIASIVTDLRVSLNARIRE
ncbi:MAG: phenylalanyl-tRNA synthetase beta chain [Gammaproteobacteria bacterium]|nr:phenylalanyl-tRNA synthetase beta chain [Gammaproteobacteria bacterium]